MARESWTDERLDDLKGQMNERFDQVDQRFKQVDQRFDRVEGQVKELRRETKDEFGEMRGDIKATQRLMVQGFIGISTLVVAGLGVMLTGFGIMAF